MNKATVRHERGKIRQEVRIGLHRLIADHTTDAGGDDAGPAPHDFLPAALGSCTAMTLRVYAPRKNWPLENAEATIALEKSDSRGRFWAKTANLGSLNSLPAPAQVRILPTTGSQSRRDVDRKAIRRRRAFLI